MSNISGGGGGQHTFSPGKRSGNLFLSPLSHLFFRRGKGVEREGGTIFVCRMFIYMSVMPFYECLLYIIQIILYYSRVL
jgi:hypothetical protein